MADIKKFDNGEDILSYIDLSSKRTLEDFEKEILAIKKVNVDLPSHLKSYEGPTFFVVHLQM